MAYENDVRRQARSIRDSIRSAKRERSRVSSLVSSGSQWWKGKGGEAFIREYKDIDDDVTRFLQYMDYAADGLERLPSLISRAERERREKADREAAKRNQ